MVTGHVTCLLVSVRLGMGRHEIFVENAKTFAIVSPRTHTRTHLQTDSSQSNLCAQTFYNLGTGITKLSILCLYGRIFKGTRRWLTPISYATALFICMVMIPQCFVYILQCVPIDSLWKVYSKPYVVMCINFQAGKSLPLRGI